MRLEMRETGSILVKARKDDVLGVLKRVVADGTLVRPDRLEGAGTTYVVREAADGTQVFHMRSEARVLPATGRERETLRREVQADLFQLRRVLDAEAGSR